MPAMHRIVLATAFSFLSCVAPALVAADGEQAALPVSDTGLEAALSGEFALQAGRLDEAARHYLDAARASGDVGLAERATRIALLARQNELSGEALRLWQQLGKASASMHAAEAALALRLGERRQLYRQLDALLGGSLPNGWRYALLALMADGDSPLAAEALAHVHKRALLPADAEAWLAAAELARQLRQPQLLERLAEEAARRWPEDTRILLLQAVTTREVGDLARARAQLSALQARMEGMPPLRLALAEQYEALGDAASAALVLAGGEQDLQTRALRAAMLESADDKEGLRKLYVELEQHYPNRDDEDPRPWLLLGQVAESLDDHQQALHWYAALHDTALAEIARLRAAITRHGMGEKEQAFAELRQLQLQADIDPEVQRDAYLTEAELYREDGNTDAEFAAYARGLAALPDEIAILYARGLAWERLDDIARAEADLRQVLLIAPDNVAALNALGYTLADRTTRYREALELIDRARVAEPGNAAIIDSHGWVLYRLGRKQEALAQLKRAFALQKDAEIAAHIGEVLWMLGRRQEARQYLDEAIRIDPENRSLKRTLERIGVTP